jgi:ribonuclease E
MSKEIYISSTPHETRLAIVENDALTEIYYERENEYTLAGSIYNGRVTRVLPGMQSAFVDIGLERDAFLYITDFMEEVGDSADFETSGNGEGRDRRRDSRDRSGSRDIAALPTPEGASTNPEESPRTERRGGDRGDRRRRGRGRDRDRQPRGEHSNRSERPETTSSYGAPESGYEATEDDFNREPGFTPTEPEVPIESSEFASTDSAVASEGQRRWRGRRGRRRGRGPVDNSEQTFANEASQPSTGPFSAPSHEEDIEEISASPDLDDSDAPIESVYAQPQESYSEPRAELSEPRSEQHFNQRPDQPRSDRDRDRNRGGRDRGGRNRGSRDDRRDGRRDDRSPRNDDRAPRVPRGFAPKTNLYGVEDTPAYGAEAPAGEPIILPGESLSKYRKPGEEAPAAAKAAAAPQAETIALPTHPGYVISAGWDGGSVLPGESLSRHRRAERQESQPTQPSAQHRVEDLSALRKPAPAPEPVIAEEPAEYEPTEASASYRVDPIAQSEFRHSAPVVEAEPEPITPEPVAEIAAHTEPAAEEDASGSDVWDWQKPSEGIVSHDVTTIQSTGEMLSAIPTIEPETTASAPQETDPASPIHHESAIVTPAGSIADDTSEFAQQISSGDLIEEEIVEDEEPHIIHASSIEEMDDLDEEETLEGAADLGSMIREMSIDQYTAPGDSDEIEADENDYEAFEEEDSVEEQIADDIDEENDTEEEDAISETPVSEDDADSTPSESNGLDYAASPAPSRDRDRGRGRRDGRRDGRRGGRDGRDRGSRYSGGSGDQDRGRGRQSMQATNLPAISDLLKPGQEVLVQIAKEPIAKKGARITSHIALPGRFLVFMPTVNHTGVSRKIESDSERRRLKEILLSEKGSATGGFIVRTAASGASEEELRSDLRFLLNLWDNIKSRSESSKSPALIYHDLNLVERILRDQVTDNFSAIWVDTETDYERILRFLQRFQPSLIRRVKLYTKETPLFEQFGITEEINKALRSKVWLKSGGSIVINQTEALVAIDINTGKFVGKTARLEDTIVKTNLDAIPEIVRQIRLRDLGGIIIIDFIDMDERKNRNRVMAALEEELKTDRAPSKVLQFNDFGLVAITRKRVKQSLERTLSTQCNVCVGTGMVKSPITVCNDIYIEMRKMHKHLDRGDVMLRVHPEVVKTLKSSSGRWLQEMEEMVGKTILVKSDPALHPEQFDIH